MEAFIVLLIVDKNRSFIMTIEIYLFLAITQTILSAFVAILSLIRYRSRSLIVKLIGLDFSRKFFGQHGILVCNW